MSKLIALSEFIARSKTIHNNKYGYSKAIYRNNGTKLVITCPVHGDFEQTPNQHLKGRGCRLCAIDANRTHRTKTTASFISEAAIKHNNKYTYASTTYVNNRIPIIITCAKHGNFKQSPSSHLAGQGCPKCANELKRTRNTKQAATFIKEATSIHNGKYTYDSVLIKNVKTKVTITCGIHGDFKQRPSDHLKGHGCPRCGTYGFKPDLPAVLYYISINNGQAYKIGVTNKTLTERFLVSEMKTIHVLSIESFASGALAKEKEQQILQEFKEYKYTGVPLLSTGNTELFSKDILQKDVNDNS